MINKKAVILSHQVSAKEPKQYDKIWIHREMLLDKVCCNTFHGAISNIVKLEMVVLNIGAGSGILSMVTVKLVQKYILLSEHQLHLWYVISLKNGLQDRIEKLS